MAIQSTVGLYAPVAVPGQAATPNQSVYTPQTFLADDTNGVHVGRFVWIDSDGNASNTQVASTLPLGFAERVVDAPNYAVTSDGSDVVPPTHPVTVAVKGDYFQDPHRRHCRAGRLCDDRRHREDGRLRRYRHQRHRD